MFTRRNSEAARIALNKSLAIAEEYGDVANQLQLLSLLHMFHHRIGDFKTTLHYAKRSFAVSETIADPAAIALAHSLLGSSLHHIGTSTAPALSLRQRYSVGRAQAGRTIYLDFEPDYYAGVALARTLWLQGARAQGISRAKPLAS